MKLVHWLLKKAPSREDIARQRRYAVLRGFLHYRYLWHWNRKTVGRACMIGMIAAFTPWPLQMLQSATMAIVFRAHLPLSVALVWVTNPVTIPVLLFGVYFTGLAIIRPDFDGVNFEWTGKWFYDNWSLIWQPTILGCIIHAALWGTVLRAAVLWVWRRRILKRWHNRSRESS